MSAPNSKQSDARNTHIPSLEFEMPVAVSSCVCSCTVVLEWTAVSATDGHLLLGRGRIQGGGVPVRVLGGAVVVVAVGREVRVVGRRQDRKSVGEGKSGAVVVSLGGRRI